MTVLKHTYLECVNEHSSKFYFLLLTQIGGFFETYAYYGRIGTAGLRASKYAGRSVDIARAVYKKVETEKLKKGYRPVPLPSTWLQEIQRANTLHPPLMTLTPVSVAFWEASAAEPNYAVHLLYRGLRALVFIPKMKAPARIVDEFGVDVSDYYRSLLRDLDPFNPIPPDSIFDVEIIKNGSQLRAFDILRYRGQDVRNLSLEERSLLLSQAFDELESEKQLNENWVKVDLKVADEKAALLAAAKMIGLSSGEQLVLKDLRSPYDSDGRSWLVSGPLQ